MSKFSSKRDYSQFEGDSKLLETGKMSDCIVKCGGRTWHLHKMILCSRNKYFEAVFQGGFQEMGSSEITLEELDPDIVDVVIHHIYLSKTAALSNIGIKDDAQFYKHIFEIYRHAGYLQAPSLLDTVTKELKDRLGASARILFSNYFRDHDPEKFRKAHTDPMTAAIYGFTDETDHYDTYEPLRAELLRFIEACYPILSRLGDEFYNYLAQAPGLSAAVLKMVNEKKSSKSLIPNIDVRCMYCNGPIAEELSPDYPQAIAGISRQPRFGVVANVTGGLRYFCNSGACLRKINAKTAFSE